MAVDGVNRNPSDTTDEPDPFADRRRAMVDQIAGEFGLARPEVGALTPEIRRALARVPRHRFVPSDQRSRAYEDRPLPIGYGQTISQPFIVALMTQIADAGPGSRVLEIGTGSGYQAAVLAEMGAEVFTIEIVPELARQAAADLASLGYDRVEVRHGDGWAGWPEAAPFDAVLITAATPEVPEPLLDQLAVGGRMVLPIGDPWETQDLQLLVKRDDGTLAVVHELPVAFVPLTRLPDEADD